MVCARVDPSPFGIHGSWHTDFRKQCCSLVFSCFQTGSPRLSWIHYSSGWSRTCDSPASAYHVLRLYVYHCALSSRCFLSLAARQSPQGQHHARSLFRITSVEMKNRHTYVGLKHLNLNDPPNEINCTHIIKSGKFSAIREDVWL